MTSTTPLMKKCRSMIVLLDLSAAFDTIDIDTLLRRLEHTFGITGPTLQWLRTYLEDRKQYVRVRNDRSTAVSSKFGVPQGSVLSRKLFATYIARIAGVISAFGIHHTQYADDTQLYIELRNDNLSRLNDCFLAVYRWFAEPSLQPGKIRSDRDWYRRQKSRVRSMRYPWVTLLLQLNSVRHISRHPQQVVESHQHTGVGGVWNQEAR